MKAQWEKTRAGYHVSCQNTLSSCKEQETAISWPWTHIKELLVGCAAIGKCVSFLGLSNHWCFCFDLFRGSALPASLNGGCCIRPFHICQTMWLATFHLGHLPDHLNHKIALVWYLYSLHTCGRVAWEKYKQNLISGIVRARRWSVYLVCERPCFDHQLLKNHLKANYFEISYISFNHLILGIKYTFL